MQKFMKKLGSLSNELMHPQLAQWLWMTISQLVGVSLAVLQASLHQMMIRTCAPRAHQFREASTTPLARDA